MPLRPGRSKAVVSENIAEFHTGKTYANTAAKYGKKRADKQAVAVALNTARKTGGLVAHLKRTAPKRSYLPRPI